MAVELGNSATLAVTHAERARTELGHRHLGVEHLFLGVVALEDSEPAPAAAAPPAWTSTRPRGACAKRLDRRVPPGRAT